MTSHVNQLELEKDIFVQLFDLENQYAQINEAEFTLLGYLSNHALVC